MVDGSFTFTITYWFPFQGENFQMERPTGVMKQLQALWKILEHTDTEIYEHLSLDVLVYFKSLISICMAISI